MITAADWAWYNSLIWPAPILAYAVGAAIAVFVFLRFPRRNLVISILLALLWIGGAVTFALMVRTDATAVPLVFIAAFSAEAVLIVRAAFRGRLHFGFSGSPRSMIGLFLVGYALVLYPLIGWALGRPFPNGPAFGIAPCPITIFTFGLLLLTDAHLPKHLVTIPALWSLFGITAALTLGVGEDLVLIVAAPAAILLLASRAGLPGPNETPA